MRGRTAPSRRYRRQAPIGGADRQKLREARGIVFAHPTAAAPFMTQKRGELTNPLLSVVMPVFNERETIGEIISRVLAVPLRIELIVVDDGSSDGTPGILRELQQQFGFRLVLQPRNEGK